MSYNGDAGVALGLSRSPTEQEGMVDFEQAETGPGRRLRVYQSDEARRTEADRSSRRDHHAFKYTPSGLLGDVLLVAGRVCPPP